MTCGKIKRKRRKIASPRLPYTSLMFTDLLDLSLVTNDLRYDQKKRRKSGRLRVPYAPLMSADNGPTVTFARSHNGEGEQLLPRALLCGRAQVAPEVSCVPVRQPLPLNNFQPQSVRVSQGLLLRIYSVL